MEVYRRLSGHTVLADGFGSLKIRAVDTKSDEVCTRSDETGGRFATRGGDPDRFLSLSTRIVAYGVRAADGNIFFRGLNAAGPADDMAEKTQLNKSPPGKIFRRA